MTATVSSGPSARQASVRRPPAGPPPRRRWPWVLAASLVVALLAVVGYVVWFSSLLGLQQVTVQGGDQTLTAAVRSAVDIPTGTPLIRVDLDQVRAQVGGLPEVADVTVARSWPHGLIVTVRERTPVAVTEANGATWLVDSSGLPYLQLPSDSSAPAGLVTLQLASPGPDDPATVAALTVLESMTAEFRATVSTVAATTPYQVTVKLADGRTVLWGDADNSARKMQILPALLAQPGSTFDISDPDLVAVR